MTAITMLTTHTPRPQRWQLQRMGFKSPLLS
jgi:hypothetical protein